MREDICAQVSKLIHAELYGSSCHRWRWFLLMKWHAQNMQAEVFFFLFSPTDYFWWLVLWFTLGIWSTTEANWPHKPGFDCTEFYAQAIRADARYDKRGRPRPGPISQSRATANSEHLIRVTWLLPVNGIWFWRKWKPEPASLFFQYVAGQHISGKTCTVTVGGCRPFNSHINTWNIILMIINMS